MITSSGKSLNFLVQKPRTAEQWAIDVKKRVVPFLKKSFHGGKNSKSFWMVRNCWWHLPPKLNSLCGVSPEDAASCRQGLGSINHQSSSGDLSPSGDTKAAAEARGVCWPPLACVLCWDCCLCRCHGLVESGGAVAPRIVAALRCANHLYPSAPDGLERRLPENVFVLTEVDRLKLNCTCSGGSSS